MTISTLTKHSAVALLSLTLAVACSSNAKKQDEAAMQDAAAQAEAAAIAQAEAEAAAAREAAAREAAEREAEARRAAATRATIDYTVVRGDSLWSIAAQGQTYGNSYAWPLIYKANKAQIKDADLIFPGQVFAIDTARGGADMDAAIEHAKTRGAWSIGVIEVTDSEYLAQ